MNRRGGEEGVVFVGVAVGGGGLGGLGGGVVG